MITVLGHLLVKGTYLVYTIYKNYIPLSEIAWKWKTESNITDNNLEFILNKGVFNKWNFNFLTNFSSKLFVTS